MNPDLHQLARRAMIERGFLAETPKDAQSEVDAKGDRVTESSIYAAAVENKTYLTYKGVGAWLDGDSANTSDIDRRILSKIQQSSELQEQLRLQDRAAENLRKARHEAGALTFQT